MIVVSRRECTHGRCLECVSGHVKKQVRYRIGEYSTYPQGMWLLASLPSKPVPSWPQVQIVTSTGPCFLTTSGRCHARGRVPNGRVRGTPPPTLLNTNITTCLERSRQNNPENTTATHVDLSSRSMLLLESLTAMHNNQGGIVIAIHDQDLQLEKPQQCRSWRLLLSSR